jgi:hypothetical protein
VGGGGIRKRDGKWLHVEVKTEGNSSMSSYMINGRTDRQTNVWMDRPTCRQIDR